MNIFGHEYGFMLTVGASAEIAEMCPDGDIGRIGEIADAKTADAIRFTAKFVAAMARGFDDAERFAGREITHEPLTAEMVMALPATAIQDIQAEAFAAFRESMKTTVEVAPSKKKVASRSKA